MHHPLRLPLLLALVLGLWAIPFSAFMADDFILLGALERVTPATWSGPATLYTLADGVPEHVRAMKDVGAFPWFFEPDYQMTFLRPLSSLLLAADHALWGLRPWGYVAHSAIWYLLLVLGTGLVFRQTLPVPLQRLAGVLFAVSWVQQGLSWTATRHVTVAAALGFLSFAAWLRGWRTRRWPWVGLSLAGFAGALAGGESALGVLGFVAAWELLGEERPRWARLGLLSPLLLAWLVAYGLFGYGARTSGYLDPLHQPLDFLLELPGRLLFLAGALLGGGHADLWVLAPPLRVPLMLAGAALVAGFAWVLRRALPPPGTPGRRAVLAWAAGGTLALVPFAGTPIGARCLVVPMAGAAVALAAPLHAWFSRTRRGGAFGVAVVLLIAIHLGFAPLQRLGGPPLFRELMWHRVVAASETLALTEAEVRERPVVVLHAPDLFVGLHTWFYRALFHLPMPGSFWTLSFAPCEPSFTRAGPDTLLMEGCPIATPAWRTDDAVDLAGLHVTILDADSHAVRAAAFRFERPLEEILFLTWRDGALRRVAAP